MIPNLKLILKPMTPKLLFQFQYSTSDPFYLILNLIRLSSNELTKAKNLQIKKIQQSMNPNPIILRANLFKKQQANQSIFCSICFQTQQQMFRCSGTCSSNFCFACIIQNRTSYCPRKCTLYSKLLSFKNKIQYHCPYNSSCPIQIHSIDDFNKHSKQCSFMTAWAANWFQTQLKYECLQHHQLIFVNDNNYRDIFQRGSHFYMAINQTCTFCRETSLCKSACLICKGDKDRAVFCIKCRPVPCTSEKCPIGHNLQFSRGFGEQMTCDFCGIIAKNQGGVIYGDRQCNFDICEVCHSKASKQHRLVPLPNIIPEELKANK